MQALVNSRASECFLDFALAQELNLPILKKKSSLTVEIVDSQKFSLGEKEAYKLPKNCQYDCEIKLLPNSQPSWGPINELSTQRT
ncbi:6832_t:CDS:2 [Cetraspora pellucida]|uniref:6832_t:CDS:1 n=1 Tax=Cetraspora pellucida TaxID=1433469 RepID=A0A9N8VTJ6_9GLOM|nr:6832_t:CDS:2 [Cetraspora pellucida]